MSDTATRRLGLEGIGAEGAGGGQDELMAKHGRQKEGGDFPAFGVYSPRENYLCRTGITYLGTLDRSDL